MLSLDLVQTLAFGGLALFAGYGARRLMPPLARFNVPAAVVGGLVVAATVSAAQAHGTPLVVFDTTLQAPLMIAFFTSIGFGASLSLLRVGGPLVLVFFAVSSAVAILQNVVGIALAVALGQPPLVGVLAGSVTLTGGPGTGLAFAPLFEQAGVHAAGTLALASAMVGIVTGGVIGAPLGTWLIARRGLATPIGHGAGAPITRGTPPQSCADGHPALTAQNLAEARMADMPVATPSGEDREAYLLLKTLVVMLTAMWLGGVVSGWISARLAAAGMALPPYIGAMIVAAVIRNLDELTGLVGISQPIIDDLGSVSLSLFLVLALMTLRLWEIVHLAVPLTIILTVQVVVIAVLSATVVFRVSGRDYQGAVMASGFCGFMLGTTANAMANMEALVARYGAAPRAFLVVPIVGAFFIDFTNGLIITVFLNVFK